MLSAIRHSGSLNSKSVLRSVSGHASTFSRGFFKTRYSFGSIVKKQLNTAPRLFGVNVRFIVNKNARQAEFEKTLAMIDACSQGNLAEIRRLIEEGVSVNQGDYDKRYPLHLAAAEGHIETVKYLVEECDADVNVMDRFGQTPLSDALTNGRTETLAYLRSKGSMIQNQEDAIGQLIQAVYADDLEIALKYIEAGIDVNSGDYDARYPLHIACAEGKVDAVKFLLSHGADPNVVDRFGSTPFQDAERGVGAEFVEIRRLLLDAGASTTATRATFSGAALVTALHDSLPVLAWRGDWDYVEAWLPNPESSEFVSNEWWLRKDLLSRYRAFGEANFGVISPNDSKSVLSQSFETRKTVKFDQEELGASSLGSRYDDAESIGFQSGGVIPVIHEDNVVALLRYYSTKDVEASGSEIEYLAELAYGCVSAGVFGINKDPVFPDRQEGPPGQREQVFKMITAQGVFNPCLVFGNVQWFYNMGLQSVYFELFDADIIVGHIHAYIASQQFAETTGSPEDIWLHIENNEKLLGTSASDGEQVLFMVPHEHRKLIAVERHIQNVMRRIPEGQNICFEMFTSSKPLVPHGTKPLAVYYCAARDWNQPPSQRSLQSMDQIASAHFLRDKKPIVKERYFEVIKETNERVASAYEVFDPYPDGTIPMMFATKGVTHSALAESIPHITQILQHHEVVPKRKFIETFSNGTTVFSFYLPSGTDHQRIDDLLNDFYSRSITPTSELTDSFLAGVLSTEEYTYATVFSRCLYYFLDNRSEEYQALKQALQGNQLNLGRLRGLVNRLKSEAVSPSRINEAIQANPDLMSKLCRDFEYRTTNLLSREERMKPDQELDALIASRTAGRELESQVLSLFAVLNRHVTKTNFFKKPISAISLRFDPAFLSESELPDVPFAMFFVMNHLFQGFHIRFSDIARGGIRLIRSGNGAAYQKNLNTLFAENYGLANTQNKKNKDIPEFGSKGTVFLHQGTQSMGFHAFQCYISALLDILVIQNGDSVVDNYGQDELLFLGPDEGTADWMSWACKYSARKGYPFWRSFTTGKPPILGGIPHDTYGMTTRSVHQYVVNSLAKLGLDETQCTKVQTGGPDGDLGSNEILLSKDKTIAIIDGSGVLYDPRGLDRTELVRLAQERKMGDHFDTSKLGPDGFRVLCEDQNVTLPNGTLVESGLKFRNDFHLNPLCKADMFVPCGGRPESINLQNVHKLIDEKTGEPLFKIIVEGANLFCTQDARHVLEDAGVVLFKDASTNKGGVTCSSNEVLAALTLNDEEFEEHMSVKDLENPPAFYKEYVNQVIQRIESDADKEFECVWREHERTKTHRYLLTDIVSEKINALCIFISQSNLYDDVQLRRAVIDKSLPPLLKDLIGIDECMNRIPENYLRSMFSTHLASNYIYSYGIDASEFSFFEYMQQYLEE